MLLYNILFRNIKLLMMHICRDPPIYAQDFTYYAQIMLNINFIPQFPWFANKLALYG